MLPRLHGAALDKKLNNFKLVTILGPRQSGKTTFVRHHLPSWHYLDLERESDRVPLDEDPERRLSQLGRAVVVDEAQRLPSLFPALRSHLDRLFAEPGAEPPGAFVLLGSASPKLVTEISETLAGRTALLHLGPLLVSEVLTHTAHSFEHLWHRGGFPEAFLQDDDNVRTDWLDAYARTFIERDLPAMGVDVSSGRMRRLWAMLAHVNANLWNASQLAASMGVSPHTVERYIDILDKAFLVRRLAPYHANIGKRLSKRAKIIFRDSGLLHFFHSIQTPEQLHTHPSRGASWESFVIEQLLSALELQAAGVEGFHWRTAGGAEVDLLVRYKGQIYPFEIKLKSAPRRADVRGLTQCMTDLGLKKGWVLHAGEQTYELSNAITAMPAKDLLSDLSYVF